MRDLSGQELSSGAVIPGRLSDDARLSAMGFLAAGGGCALVLVPALFLGLGFLTSGTKGVSDFFVGAAIVSLGVVFVVWVGAYYGMRFLFFRDAVRVAGAVPRSAIPRTITAAGVAEGQAEWAIRLATRGSMGRVGRCWIELYPSGIQVWKGAGHAEPCWQFAYGDLLQAESVDMISITKSGELHQFFVRLLVDRPRMAFLFGSHWRRNADAPMLAQKLRDHGVSTLSEEFEA